MSKASETARQRIKDAGNMFKVGGDLHLAEMLLAERDALLEALLRLKIAVAESVVFGGAGCDHRYLEAEKFATETIAKVQS